MSETRSGMPIRVVRRVQIWSAQTASQLSRRSGSDTCSHTHLHPCTRRMCAVLLRLPPHHHKVCDGWRDLRGEFFHSMAEEKGALGGRVGLRGCRNLYVCLCDSSEAKRKYRCIGPTVSADLSAYPQLCGDRNEQKAVIQS
ncbi:uncharacterized protein UTRI_03488_B [Ustilago trichophora]|uniref:Uncharacterized protein n=1 Tax=Ustilago trichophora TaxID=86804 RepID=A0A5C3E3I0_9BASI|nr:uncharacterized protein UTRI_03488_B [Ustilago trichophora]